MNRAFKRYKRYHALRRRAWSYREQAEYPIGALHSDSDHIEFREQLARSGWEKYQKLVSRMLPLRARLITEGIPATDLPLPE